MDFVFAKLGHLISERTLCCLHCIVVAAEIYDEYL